MKSFVFSAAFYFIAFITVLSALGVIISRKIIYSALSLVLCFFSIAGVYLLLSADFAAISQIIIYSVGLTIVLLFAIMLTSSKVEKYLWIAIAPRSIFGLLSSGLMFLIVLFSITSGFSIIESNPAVFALKNASEQTLELIKSEGTVGIIGTQLFSKYLLPFEVLSILLLAALIGAVSIASKNDVHEKVEEEL